MTDAPPPTFTPDDELVPIAAVQDEVQGEILVGRLLADGIAASVFFEPTRELSGLEIGQSHPVQVVVRLDQAEAALRALAADNQWDDAELERQMTLLREASPILRKEPGPGHTM